MRQGEGRGHSHNSEEQGPFHPASGPVLGGTVEAESPLGAGFWELVPEAEAAASG